MNQIDDDTVGPGFDLAGHWALDPAIYALNHGSFGAAPRRVLHEQDQIRERMERNPIDFFMRRLPGELERARHQLAEFIGAPFEGLVFVENVTTGVNAVLRSLDFEPGDQILVTDHGYPACQNAVDFVAQKTGAEVVVAQVPFPLESKGEIVEAIIEKTGDQTRLALVDHVTSATALVFPIEEIVDELRARGVETLVDGAHAPGLLPLDIEAVGATYYAGNCHKWLCAPKGAGFLYVEQSRRDQIRPPVISHGASLGSGERFQAEFGWTGTDDFSPYLCVPTAISFLRSLMPGGWPAIYERNDALALKARDLLCDTLGVEAPAPDDLLGPMTSVALPEADYDELQPPLFVDPLAEKLFVEADFEVRVIGWPELPGRLIRVCCQLYNDLEEYEALCEVLPDALAGKDLIEEGELPVY